MYLRVKYKVCFELPLKIIDIEKTYPSNLGIKPGLQPKAASVMLCILLLLGD